MPRKPERRVPSGRSSMPEPRPIELDAEAILSVLIRRGVEFVVIGGFAALLYGDPGVTVDVDITPSRSRENRARLAAALEELDAKLRVPGLEDPVEVVIDAEYRDRFTTIALRTAHGDLDVTFAPDAPKRRSFSYEELAARAVVIDVGTAIPVADLDDVIASKEAAGRPKDLEDLTRLYRVRDELRREHGPSGDTSR
jgi:hypothetical protein